MKPFNRLAARTPAVCGLHCSPTGCARRASREVLSMPRIVQWILRPAARFFDGTYTSGAETCEYLRRLAAVPREAADEHRDAA